jgi:hypothetical protein
MVVTAMRKAELARRRLQQKGSSMSKGNGAPRLALPGSLPVEFKHTPIGVLGHAAVAFPVPGGGVSIQSFGGIDPFTFMCAAVASSGREIDGIDVVAKARSIFEAINNHMQKQRQQSEAAAPEPEAPEAPTEPGKLIVD